MQIVWPVLRNFVWASLVAVSSWAVVDGLAGGARCACPGKSAPSHERVDVAFFGVEMPAGDEGGAFFVETDRVPLVTGATFGWRLRLSDGSSAVQLREELELPSEPRVWRHTEETVITPDRRTAVTERLARPVDGWLENQWAFTDGDPEGAYVLRVYLDDELVKTFRFRADDMGLAADDGVGSPCGGR